MRGEALLIAMLVTSPSIAQTVAPQPGAYRTGDEVRVVRVTDAGFASSRVTNPRKPVIIEVSAVPPATAKPTIVLHNRTATRRFLATMTVRIDAAPKMNETTKKMETTYAHGTCPPVKDEPSKVDCTVTVRIDPDKRVALYPDLLARAAQSQRVTVKLRRFGENTAVANAKMYLGILKGAEPLPEVEDETSATPAGAVGFAIDPRFAADDTQTGSPAVLDSTTGHHFIGGRRTHLPGNARLDFSRNFGEDVNTDLSFLFNDADFGDQEEKGTVTADKYKMTVFGGHGFTLEFGKYEFVGATSVLPIAETGQGFTISHGLGSLTVSASYLVKRAVAATETKHDDRDQADYIFQARSITIRDAVFDVVAIGGRDRKLSDPHVHHTVGVQGGWGRPLTRTSHTTESPSAWFGIDAGVYRSNRTRGDGIDAKEQPVRTRAGRGTAGVVRMSVSWGIKDQTDTERATVPHTAALQIAGGSADRPSTSSDDSFTGEVESFAPDVIFFSALATPLNKGADHIPSGLANKRYAALEYTYTGWAGHPLTGLDPPSLTIRYANDRFRSPVFGSMSIGNEIDLQLSAQARTMVTLVVLAGYFRPAPALRSFIERNVWSAGMTVKVEAP
ncbi:MAG TPA: hypothetical protein VI670_14525 [Thermoanaerobaculia bacterium]|jgi:hypothetical protein